MTPPQDGAPAPERLLWLDITRVLCAVMILGIHWLRPGYKLGLFGPNASDLVVDYQSKTGGLRLFHDAFIAGFAPNLSTWLANIIGILGGFGWEAVSALVLISGFSLALSQRSTSYGLSGWFSWFGKRAKRILIPFYLVALPGLALAACAIVVLHYEHGTVASILETKLSSQFQTSPLGVALSHIFLFDPFAYQWSANFFVPAWWFTPAILLAYVTYPIVWHAGRIAGGVPLLAVSAFISIVAYIGSNSGVLTNETWYFIVLHQSFNFSLGVVVANLWLGPRRPGFERALGDVRVFAGALAVFVAGNLANWTNETRPFASILFGPSLVIILVFISKRLAAWQHANKLMFADPYYLYLVHQPFAFPIALAARMLFHGYGLFFGWFIFVGTAALAARALGFVQASLGAVRSATVSRSRVPAARNLRPDEAR